MDKDTGSGESTAGKMSSLLRDAFEKEIKNRKMD